MIRMSKKNRELVASLINSVTVWNDYVMRHSNDNTDKMTYGMDRHHVYGRELNKLLGVEAIHCYRSEGVV